MDTLFLSCNPYSSFDTLGKGKTRITKQEIICYYILLLTYHYTVITTLCIYSKYKVTRL